LHWAQRHDDDSSAFERKGPTDWWGEQRRGVAFCPYAACGVPLFVEVSREWAGGRGGREPRDDESPFGPTELAWVERVRIEDFSSFTRRQRTSEAKQTALGVMLTPLLAAMGGPAIVSNRPYLPCVSLLGSFVFTMVVHVGRMAAAPGVTTMPIGPAVNALSAIWLIIYGPLLVWSFWWGHADLRRERASRLALARRVAARQSYVEFRTRAEGTYRRPPPA
jgi:hypothetical protein